MRCKLRPEPVATRSRQHDPKCRLKSNQYTLIIPHKVIHLLCHSGSQKQSCAYHKSTNRSVPSEASEVSTASSIFIFISSSSTGELSALSQSEARFAKIGEYSQNMLREAFWSPTIASSHFDEYLELGSRSKHSPS